MEGLGVGMELLGHAENLEITPDVIAALQAKWKTRDVPEEILKMHLWLLRYPKRRPKRMWVFVDNWLKAAPAVKLPPTVVNSWWTTDERTINQGAAIGLAPRPGESMAQFKDRVADKMRKSA